MIYEESPHRFKDVFSDNLSVRRSWGWDRAGGGMDVYEDRSDKIRTRKQSGNGLDVS